MADVADEVETDDGVATETKESVKSDDETSNNTDAIVKDIEMSNNEQNMSGSSTDTEQYASNVHYEGSVAIYTDAATSYQYIWCTEKDEWIPRPNQTLSSVESSNNESEEENHENSSKKVKLDPSVNELRKENDDKNEDARENYGFENDTHTYTDKDGVVYIWDAAKTAWFPKVDDTFLAHYQMSYGFVDNTSEVKDNKVDGVVKDSDKVCEKEGSANKDGPKKKPQPPSWFDINQAQNTKVYVSGLPLDITEEEFCEVMSKCGLIMRDPTTQRMKVKLYTEGDGKMLKGDALCSFIRIESVDLALNLLDGSDVRGHKIKVQSAKFEMKGQYNPALKPKKKKKDKEKLKKMQEKLFDWRPEKMRGERSKHERVVIIKNLFEPSLFDTQVQLILEFQQDLREESAKCGTVRKVIIYDRHPEGVAQISMSQPEEADAVVAMLNGRWFNQRQLTAEIWDGKTKYKIGETDADRTQRLDKWGKFLETGEEAAKRLAKEAEQNVKANVGEGTSVDRITDGLQVTDAEENPIVNKSDEFKVTDDVIAHVVSKEDESKVADDKIVDVMMKDESEVMGDGKVSIIRKEDEIEVTDDRVVPIVRKNTDIIDERSVPIARKKDETTVLDDKTVPIAMEEDETTVLDDKAVTVSIKENA